MKRAGSNSALAAANAANAVASAAQGEDLGGQDQAAEDDAEVRAQIPPTFSFPCGVSSWWAHIWTIGQVTTLPM